MIKAETYLNNIHLATDEHPNGICRRVVQGENKGYMLTDSPEGVTCKHCLKLLEEKE